MTDDITTYQEVMTRFITNITEDTGRGGHSSQTGLKWLERARKGDRPVFLLCLGDGSGVRFPTWQALCSSNLLLAPKEEVLRFLICFTRCEAKKGEGEERFKSCQKSDVQKWSQGSDLGWPGTHFHEHTNFTVIYRPILPEELRTD